MTLVPLLCALLVPWPGATGTRHHDTDSYAHLVVGGERVKLALELDTDSLMAEVEALPPQGEDWEAVDLEPILARAAEWVDEHWQLTLDGTRVEIEPRGFELLKAFDPLVQSERNVSVALRFEFTAPHHDAAATLQQTLFEGREIGHRHTLLLERSRGDAGRKLAAEPQLNEEWRVGRGSAFHFTLHDTAPGAGMRRALRAAIRGSTTIGTSPWLALFVLALALAPLPGRTRAASVAAMAGVAALAFVAARADWIAPAGWAATAAAALAVGYVAAENGFARELKLRVATAALFGVVHGMAVAPLAGRTTRAAGFSAADAAFFAGACVVGVLAGGAIGAALSRLLRERPAAQRLLPLLLIVASVLGTIAAVHGRSAADHW
ncbi:MAG: hypothetical protein EXS13_06365 [Planctomycetes bacterium]|nr:hypothetical protein [Planctomycetota bacterium]